MRNTAPKDATEIEALETREWLDSLDALQLAMAIEERFGVAVPEGEAGREVFASVDAIAAFLLRSGGSASGTPEAG